MEAKTNENQRNFIATLEGELRLIPDYQTRKRAFKMVKISEVKNEIKNLETEIENL